MKKPLAANSGGSVDLLRNALLAFLSVVTFRVYVQTTTISGIITDENEIGLVGVTHLSRSQPLAHPVMQTTGIVWN